MSDMSAANKSRRQKKGASNSGATAPATPALASTPVEASKVNAWHFFFSIVHFSLSLSILTNCFKQKHSTSPPSGPDSKRQLAVSNMEDELDSSGALDASIEEVDKDGRPVDLVPHYVEVLQASREAVETLNINAEKLNEIGGFLTGVIFLFLFFVLNFIPFRLRVSSLFSLNFGNFLLCSSRCRTAWKRSATPPS